MFQHAFLVYSCFLYVCLLFVVIYGTLLKAKQTVEMKNPLPNIFNVVHVYNTSQQAIPSCCFAIRVSCCFAIRVSCCFAIRVSCCFAISQLLLCY